MSPRALVAPLAHEHEVVGGGPPEIVRASGTAAAAG
jgi:hypothetical protein